MIASDPWWGEPYVEKYQAMEYPVLLTDPSYAVLWKNASADRMAAATHFNDAVRSHLFLHGRSTISDQFRQLSSAFVPSESLSATGLSFLLTPVWQKGAVAGCLVTLTPAPQPDPAASSDDVPSLEETERMLAALTHQTHDPTFGILSSLGIIARRNNNEFGDPDVRACVVHIVRRCYQMLHSNSNVCEYIKYQHGLKEFSPRTMDLCLFLDQLCRLVSVMVENEGVQCSYRIPDGPAIVQFDPDKIANILFNLVSNAAKFLGDKGRITVDMQLTDDRALISVTDNGLGMPSSVLARAFDPYFSLDPRTGGLCGDGLGLVLCQLAARLHGGAVAVDSQEGKGTRAVLSLPLRPGDPTHVTLGDVTGSYMYNRYSDLYITLSDVCDVYRVFDRNEVPPMEGLPILTLTGRTPYDNIKR